MRMIRSAIAILAVSIPFALSVTVATPSEAAGPPTVSNFGHCQQNAVLNDDVGPMVFIRNHPVHVTAVLPFGPVFAPMVQGKGGGVTNHFVLRAACGK